MNAAVTQLTHRLTLVADAIEQRKPDAAIQALLRDGQAACRRAAEESPGELPTLLRNFVQALETWDRLWPQMGGRAEFRLAVTREARQWAARLTKAAA